MSIGCKAKAVGKRLSRGVIACATVLAALILAPSAAAYLYWVGGTSAIGRANLDGTAVNPAFIAGLHNPEGLAVDAGHVYWTEHELNVIGTGAISRASLDGTDVGEFAFAGTYPNDVAVNGEDVYWTDAIDETVTRASLRFPSGPSLISGAFGTVVAADDEHVYWASGGAIARANPDGTQIEPLFIAGLDNVRALALDARHIYWADAGNNKIGRADLDGTHVIQNFINGVVGVRSVAVDGQHVYWTTTDGASIGRAGLDGTDVQSSFIPGLAGAGMLAVDSFPHPTATAVQCEPARLLLGQVLTCTATVTDPASPAPQGVVAFTATEQGAFAPSASCTLVPATAVASTCAINFRPFGAGTFTITGAYLSDAAHGASSADADSDAVSSGRGSRGGHTPSNRFRLDKPRLNRANGSATQTVRVPGPGKLVLTGKGIKRHATLVRRRGPASVTIRAANGARRALTKTGSARVAVTLTYVPAGGTARARSEHLTLKWNGHR